MRWRVMSRPNSAQSAQFPGEPVADPLRIKVSQVEVNDRMPRLLHCVTIARLTMSRGASSARSS